MSDEKTKTMSAVNKVNFLLQAGALFPPNGHVNQLLKSHFLTTSREVAEHVDKLRPNKEFGETRMCQKCSAVWLDGNLKLHIKSKKLKRAKQKKLVAKAEAGDVLNRKQRAKAKWLGRNAKSRVEITCLLCKHKTKIHLDKPKISKDSTTTTTSPSSSSAPSSSRQDNSNFSGSLLSTSQKKKAKKKKKDKFVGLNSALVAAASTSGSSKGRNTSETVTSTTATTKVVVVKPSTSSISSSSSGTSVLNSAACAVTGPAPAPAQSTTITTSLAATLKTEKSVKEILPQSKNLKKGKNKKPKNQMVNSNSTPRTVSKTQQKNTLLQLAQLLKSSASLSSNARPNPLESLLRRK